MWHFSHLGHRLGPSLSLLRYACLSGRGSSVEIKEEMKNPKTQALFGQSETPDIRTDGGRATQLNSPRPTKHL